MGQRPSREQSVARHDARVTRVAARAVNTHKEMTTPETESKQCPSTRDGDMEDVSRHGDASLRNAANKEAVTAVLQMLGLPLYSVTEQAVPGLALHESLLSIDGAALPRSDGDGTLGDESANASLLSGLTTPAAIVPMTRVASLQPQTPSFAFPTSTPPSLLAPAEPDKMGGLSDDDLTRVLRSLGAELEPPPGELECIASGFVSYKSYTFIASLMQQTAIAALCHAASAARRVDKTAAVQSSSGTATCSTFGGALVSHDRLALTPADTTATTTHGSASARDFGAMPWGKYAERIRLCTLAQATSDQVGQHGTSLTSPDTVAQNTARALPPPRPPAVAARPRLTVRTLHELTARDEVLDLVFSRGSATARAARTRVAAVDAMLQSMSPLALLRHCLRDEQLVGLTGAASEALTRGIAAITMRSAPLSAQYMELFLQSLPLSLSTEVAYHYLAPSSPISAPECGCGDTIARNMEFFVSMADRATRLGATCPLFNSAEKVLLCIAQLSNLASNMLSSFVLHSTLTCAAQLARRRDSATDAVDTPEELSVSEAAALAQRCCREFVQLGGRHLNALQRRFPNVFLLSTLDITAESETQEESEARTCDTDSTHAPSAAEARLVRAMGEVTILTEDDMTGQPSVLAVVTSILTKLLFLFAGGLRSISADDRRGLARRLAAALRAVARTHGAAPNGVSNVDNKNDDEDDEADDDMRLSAALHISAASRLVALADLFDLRNVSACVACATVWRVFFQFTGLLPLGRGCPREMCEWLPLFPFYAVNTAARRVLLRVQSTLAGQAPLVISPVMRGDVLRTTAHLLGEALRTAETQHALVTRTTATQPTSYALAPTFASRVRGVETAFTSREMACKELYACCAAESTATHLPQVDITTEVRLSHLDHAQCVTRLRGQGMSDHSVALLRACRASSAMTAVVVSWTAAGHRYDRIGRGDELTFVVRGQCSADRAADAAEGAGSLTSAGLTRHAGTRHNGAPGLAATARGVSTINLDGGNSAMRGDAYASASSISLPLIHNKTPSTPCYRVASTTGVPVRSGSLASVSSLVLYSGSETASTVSETPDEATTTAPAATMTSNERSSSDPIHGDNVEMAEHYVVCAAFLIAADTRNACTRQLLFLHPLNPTPASSASSVTMPVARVLHRRRAQPVLVRDTCGTGYAWTSPTWASAPCTTPTPPAAPPAGGDGTSPSVIFPRHASLKSALTAPGARRDAGEAASQLCDEVPFALGWLLGNALVNGMMLRLPLAPLAFRLLGRGMCFGETMTDAVVCRACDLALLAAEVREVGQDERSGTTSFAKWRQRRLAQSSSSGSATRGRDGRDGGYASLIAEMARRVTQRTIWNVQGKEQASRLFWQAVLHGVRTSGLKPSPLFTHCGARESRAVLCGGVTDDANQQTVADFTFSAYFSFFLEPDMASRSYASAVLQHTVHCLDAALSVPEKRSWLRRITGDAQLPPEPDDGAAVAVRLCFVPCARLESSGDANGASCTLPLPSSDHYVLRLPDYMERLLLSASLEALDGRGKAEPDGSHTTASELWDALAPAARWQLGMRYERLLATQLQRALTCPSHAATHETATDHRNTPRAPMALLQYICAFEASVRDGASTADPAPAATDRDLQLTALYNAATQDRPDVDVATNHTRTAPPPSAPSSAPPGHGTRGAALSSQLPYMATSRAATSGTDSNNSHGGGSTALGLSDSPPSGAGANASSTTHPGSLPVLFEVPPQMHPAPSRAGADAPLQAGRASSRSGGGQEWQQSRAHAADASTTSLVTEDTTQGGLHGDTRRTSAKKQADEAVPPSIPALPKLSVQELARKPVATTEAPTGGRNELASAHIHSAASFRFNDDVVFSALPRPQAAVGDALRARGGSQSYVTAVSITSESTYVSQRQGQQHPETELVSLTSQGDSLPHAAPHRRRRPLRPRRLSSKTGSTIHSPLAAPAPTTPSRRGSSGSRGSQPGQEHDASSPVVPASRQTNNTVRRRSLRRLSDFLSSAWSALHGQASDGHTQGSRSSISHSEQSVEGGHRVAHVGGAVGEKGAETSGTGDASGRSTAPGGGESQLDLDVILRELYHEV